MRNFVTPARIALALLGKDTAPRSAQQNHIAVRRGFAKNNELHLTHHSSYPPLKTAQPFAGIEPAAHISFQSRPSQGHLRGAKTNPKISPRLGGDM